MYATSMADANSITAPRSPRTSVMLRAHIFAMGADAPSDHRVVNLSDTGLCIAGPGTLKPDTIVVVSIGRIDHQPADVVWVRAGQAGLKFHRAIDLAAARARSTTTGPLTPPAAGWMADLRSPYRRS